MSKEFESERMSALKDVLQKHYGLREPTSQWVTHMLDILGTIVEDEYGCGYADGKEKVSYGQWIDHQQGSWIYAKCSECNTVHDTKTYYCPNCGAKMDEEAPQ